MAKFRYRQVDNPITIELSGDEATLTFDHIVKAVTPGQWAAIYAEDGRLLGGGIIEKTFYKGKRQDI